MTPNQIELARHALGLDGRRSVSFRNHFVAGSGHLNYAEWIAMVTAGYAKRQSGGLTAGGSDCFWLTRAGAELALRQGESLCREDFPTAVQ